MTFNPRLSRDETIAFLTRWRNHHPIPTEDDEAQHVDCFVSQYIALNRLCNELWAQNHGSWPSPRSGGGDKCRATTRLALSLDCPNLIVAIDAIGEKGLAALQEALGRTGRFFLSSENEPPHFDGYDRLTPNEQVERILEALYKLRCNMFHGAKGLEVRQQEVLSPANLCLNAVLDAGLAALRARP